MMSMRDATKMVREALVHTPREYLQRCCEMRAGLSEARLGSYIPDVDAENAEKMLRELHWEPYTHASIEPPAQGFVAPGVRGVMAVVPIDDVPEDAELRWDNSKETDFVEAVWVDAPEDAGHIVDYLVALIGPDDDNDGRPCLWTFFPGDPVQPSKVKDTYRGIQSSFGMDPPDGPLRWRHGFATSKAEAMRLGVEWVKLS